MEQPEERVLLVDANNMIMRYVAVSMKRPNSGGALYGILGFLKRFLKRPEYKITQVIFIFDSSVPNFRINLYSNYKGDRDKVKTKNDFQQISDEQIDIIKDVLPQLGIITAVLPNYEADDCIYKATEEIEDKRFIVYSADKDFQQLGSENIHVVKPINHGKVREERVDESNYFLIERCLIGDSSDSIKGVPQIGPVKAKIVINDIGESKLQNFLDNIDKCELYAETLHEYKKTIARNYNLMSLNYAYMRHTKHLQSFYIRPQPFSMNAFRTICKAHGARKYIIDSYVFQTILGGLDLDLPESFVEVEELNY